VRLNEATFIVTVFPKHPWTLMMMVPFWRICVGTYAVMLLDTIAHELGHGLFALLFGVPVKGFRIGCGPSITLWRNTHYPVQLGIVPKTGRIELGDLPNSKWKQITMYAGGVLGSVMVATAQWICLPRSAWFECVLATAVCFACILDNLCAPGSDGDAMRKLLRGNGAAA
jgi:hypothetical protein